MEQEYEAILEQQLNNMDLSGLDQLMGVGGQIGLPDYSLISIIQSLMEGKSIFRIEDITEAVKTLFLGEIRSTITLALQILIICIIMGLLQNLTNAYGEKAVGTIGSMICSCAVVAMCLGNFAEVYGLSGDSVNGMAGVMQILLPILIPLLIAMGGATSGAVLNPAILTSVTLFSTLIQKVILPALFLSCVFLLVNSLTRRNYVKKLALLLRNAAIFIMGLSVTLFSGLSALQGLVTKTADGMLVKTAQFSVDNFIPIVGGFAADSIDMILSCAGVIRNALGIVGLLAIVALLLLPLIKLLAVALIYKVAAVLVEPIGNSTISDCLNEVGNTVITLAAVVFFTAILFIIFLTILIGMGNAPW